MDYSDKTIDALITLKFGEIIESAVKEYISDVPAELERELAREHEDDIDELQLDGLTLQHCTNITVDDDALEFDYIADAEFTILTYANRYDDGTEDFGNKWLSIHCRAIRSNDAQRWMMHSVQCSAERSDSCELYPVWQ